MLYAIPASYSSLIAAHLVVDTRPDTVFDILGDNDAAICIYYADGLTPVPASVTGTDIDYPDGSSRNGTAPARTVQVRRSADESNVRD